MQHLSRFFFTHKLFNIYTLFYYWIYQYIFEVLELCSRWKIRLVIISTCSGILFLPTVYINEYSRGNGNSFNRKSRKKIIRRIGFYLTYMYYTILYLLYFTRLKIWHFQNVLNLLTYIIQTYMHIVLLSTNSIKKWKEKKIIKILFIVAGIKFLSNIKCNCTFSYACDF